MLRTRKEVLGEVRQEFWPRTKLARFTGIEIETRQQITGWQFTIASFLRELP